jgi:glucosamine-6-phosphate deaminase
MLDSESEYFTWNFMRIILSQSTQEAVDTVVTHLVDKIALHPLAVIGLATGKTMEPVYESWVRTAELQALKLDKCFFFMLDEYLGIPTSHACSFRSYIEERFLKPLKLKSDQFAFPPTHLIEAGSAGEHYETLIRQAGGIDVQLLGIGVNGHIGFNEPGSTKDSRTRLVTLSVETRQSNQAQFGSDEMPTKALSMGIGSILEAKELVMLATGKSKADAIKYLFNHHDDESCPATFLKSHPHFTLVLDPEAASKISLKI